MSAPLNSTAPRNDAYGGGTFSAAANPVAVGGTFGQAGAGGFPGPGVPPILSARNNSGSNVRIPYARCAAVCALRVFGSVPLASCTFNITFPPAG